LTSVILRTLRFVIIRNAQLTTNNLTGVENKL
jgi:hypothetical protein